MNSNYTVYLASTYGSGNYQSGNYNGTTTTSSGSSTSSSSGGSLVNTGMAVLPFVAVAVVILLAAVFIRIKKNAKITVTQPEQKGTPYGSGSF